MFDAAQSCGCINSGVRLLHKSMVRSRFKDLIFNFVEIVFLRNVFVQRSSGPGQGLGPWIIGFGLAYLGNGPGPYMGLDHVCMVSHCATLLVF